MKAIVLTTKKYFRKQFSVFRFTISLNSLKASWSYGVSVSVSEWQVAGCK